jgi:hypothetical protein
MRSLNEAIKAACELPVAYRSGGFSPSQIVTDSDYRQWRDRITVHAIRQHLREHTELLGEWVMYSENKRCGGWFIDLSARRVGYYSNLGITQQEQVFDDQLEACAHYIRHELESISHNVA